jgi:hypothetical protein
MVLARPTTQPTALAEYDLAGDPSPSSPPAGLPWPNGIGWGTMLRPDGRTQRVLLALWADAPTTIATSIYAGTVVAVSQTIAIEGAGLDPQTMWIPRHV